MAKIPKRIFLVEEPSHVCISQAYALGATLALPGTINQSKLLAALADPADPERASPTGAPQQDNAVVVAATAIGSMFTAASLGEPIDVIGTKEAGRIIGDRIAERGLTEAHDRAAPSRGDLPALSPRYRCGHRLWTSLGAEESRS